jgi:hypothetical protein
MSDRSLLRNRPLIAYLPDIIKLTGKAGIATATDGTATGTGIIVRIGAESERSGTGERKDIGKGNGDLKIAN